MKTEALLAMASSWLCDSGFTVCLGAPASVPRAESPIFGPGAAFGIVLIRKTWKFGGGWPPMRSGENTGE